MPERAIEIPRSWLRWLWPPLLALLAIGLQWLIDVPKAEMLQREDKDADASKDGSKAASKAGKKTKKTKKTKGYEARPPEHIALLRETWSDRPFESEPVEPHFRRRHEALLRSVATRLRAVVLDGKRSTAMQIRPTCKTIRCALELCGPVPVVTEIATLLPEVGVADQTLWHELREVDPARKPKQDQVCRRWILSFTIEGPSLRELQIPEAKPVEKP